MLDIVIYDDEKIHRDILKEYVIAYSIEFDAEIRIKEVCCINELHSLEQNFDILFLDLMLEDNLNGLDVGKSLRQKGFENVIVIITSRDDFLIEGYQIEAFRYLLKPLTKDAVFETLGSAINKFNTCPEKISIKCIDANYYLNIDDIIYIESYHRIRKIYTTLKVLETREPIINLMEKLPIDRFAYPHKSYLVNLNHVISGNKTFVTLSNGKEIILSRGKVNEFVLALNKFILTKRD